MPFRELRGLSREAYLATQITQLRNVYTTVKNRLLAKLKDVDITDFGAYRANALLREVNTLTKVLDVKARSWAEKSMPLSYDRGLDIAAQRIKAQGVSRFVNYDAKVHTSAVEILIDGVTLDLLTANNNMKNQIARYVRATQQQAIKDEQISKMIAEGIIEGQTRREVSNALLKEMKKNLEDGRFIPINGRNYRVDSYAELVARTRTREATTNGIVNTATYYGMDLVQWDAHEEPCEDCQQYSGRVYSISGTHPDFPALEEQPPIHPNCRCVIVPVTEDHLESSGNYGELVKLSNAPSIEVDSFAELQKQLEFI